MRLDAWERFDGKRRRLKAASHSPNFSVRRGFLPSIVLYRPFNLLGTGLSSSALASPVPIEDLHQKLVEKASDGDTGHHACKGPCREPQSDTGADAGKQDHAPAHRELRAVGIVVVAIPSAVGA
ncbi:hypothetical protein ACFQQB_44600 [Nonomuraea rubra]|uniref:hypothetical protein n=1 Tax=Nonomuraea rubra TaxID=46180 RepID=UPI00361B9C60